MEFGIFSNGERSNKIAAPSWDEDLWEIVTAEKLGFTETWVAEHLGGRRPDAQPCADLFIIKPPRLPNECASAQGYDRCPTTHPSRSRWRRPRVTI